MIRKTYLTLFGLIMVCLGFGQNVGVGTPTPTEKLEVAGTIFTNEGGVKFPDQTIQTTAAFNPPTPTIPVERGIGFIKFNNADLDGNIDSLDETKLSLLYSMDIGFAIPPFTAGDFRISKQTDRGTPNLLKFLYNATNLPTVNIFLTRPDTSGNLEIYYKIKLTNVKVAEHTQLVVPHTGGYYLHTDQIALEYQTIMFHDVPSGKCYCLNLGTGMTCGCP